MGKDGPFNGRKKEESDTYKPKIWDCYLLLPMLKNRILFENSWRLAVPLLVTSLATTQSGEKEEYW